MSGSGALCVRCRYISLPDALFCERCGGRLEPAGTAPAAEMASGEGEPVLAGGTDRGGGPDDGALVWECRVPLLTNRFILWDFLRVVVLSLVLMQGILLVMGWLVDGEILVLPIEVWAITGGVFAALLVVVMLVVLLNRYDMRFTVDSNGVRYESGRRERRINRIVLALALLSGRPGPAGAALLGYAGESGFFPWRDIHQVRVHPGQRVISLSNSWRTVLRLYCPPELFEELVARVHAHAGEAARRRGARGRPGRRHSVMSYVAWVVVAAAATIGTAAWYWVGEDAVRFSVLAGALVLLAGVLPGFVGWLLALPGLGLALYFLGCLAVEALDESPSLWRGTTYGYEYDTPLLALAALSAVVLLAMAMRRLRERET